jgi:hypothetical protein
MTIITVLLRLLVDFFYLKRDFLEMEGGYHFLAEKVGGYLFSDLRPTKTVGQTSLEGVVLVSYYYQMRLCRIWSRNAENSSALFYVVKNVTFFLWCIDCGSFANWAFWPMLPMFWQLFDSFFTLFLLCGIKSYDNFLTFFWQLFDNFLTTFWQVLTFFWKTFDNLLTTSFYFFFSEFCWTLCDTDLIGS